MVKHVTGTASQECGRWFMNLWGTSKKMSDLQSKTVDIKFKKHKHQVSAEGYSNIYIYSTYTMGAPLYS
jgi:hypothetical protein